MDITYILIIAAIVVIIIIILIVVFLIYKKRGKTGGAFIKSRPIYDPVQDEFFTYQSNTYSRLYNKVKQQDFDLYCSVNKEGFAKPRGYNEYIIAKFLYKITNNAFPTYFLCDPYNDNKVYELDFYNPIFKIAIEYNGPYHYNMFNTDMNKFINQRVNDKRKEHICKQLGILFIKLPYTFFSISDTQRKQEEILKQSDYNGENYYKFLYNKFLLYVYHHLEKNNVFHKSISSQIENEFSKLNYKLDIKVESEKYIQSILDDIDFPIKEFIKKSSNKEYNDEKYIVNAINSKFNSIDLESKSAKYSLPIYFGKQFSDNYAYNNNNLNNADIKKRYDEESIKFTNSDYASEIGQENLTYNPTFKDTYKDMYIPNIKN